MSLSFGDQQHPQKPQHQQQALHQQQVHRQQHRQQQQQQQQQQHLQHLQLNPRANVFILVNLGCEMLYVIDQRLKAQQIATDKSIQVIHDITAVLLEPKYIDSLIVGSTHANSQLLTADHCKFMLNDVATCSLMRLDENSMDKLWNLMTMVYKWQLYMSRHQHHLLEITFRHLDSIGRLHPDEKRTMLIDFTKNTLLDFWNASNDDEQLAIYRTNKAWLECFNTKISLLIRLGFQALDGAFVRDATLSYYPAFASSVGDNIYVKSIEIAVQERAALSGSSTKRIDQLVELLNPELNAAAASGAANGDGADRDDNENRFVPIEEASDFQQQFQQHLQDCSIQMAADEPLQRKSPAVACLDMSLFPDSSTSPGAEPDQCVPLSTTYNRNGDSPASSSSSFAQPSSVSALLDKDLLDLYSKLD